MESPAEFRCPACNARNLPGAFACSSCSLIFASAREAATYVRPPQRRRIAEAELESVIALGAIMMAASGWIFEVIKVPLLVGGIVIWLSATQWRYNRKYALQQFPKAKVSWYQDYQRTLSWRLAPPEEIPADFIECIAASIVRHALELNAVKIRLTAGAYGYQIEYLTGDQWSAPLSHPGFLWPNVKTFFCWMSNQDPSLPAYESPREALTMLFLALGPVSAISPGEIRVLHNGTQKILLVSKEPRGIMDGLDIFLVEPAEPEDPPAKIAFQAPSPQVDPAKRPA